MPVMKRLTVDGVNYDTVGEASVTQVQTSGTKIATVTIDGTATDLYAPEGGGDVSMTEEEVDAAVEEAFTYSVTNVNPDLVSVAANAVAYDTVQITNVSSSYVNVSVGTSSGGNDVASGGNAMPSGGYTSFAMPRTDVYVTASQTSGGGGSND